jgi:CBS domain-containing protein
MDTISGCSTKSERNHGALGDYTIGFLFLAATTASALLRHAWSTYSQILFRPVDWRAVSMRVANVLSAKGSVVAAVTPDVPVTVVLAEMVKHSVGAVVVIRDGAVAGMVWERDLIRLLHERGASLIHSPVSEIMNVDVTSCGLTDEVDDILRIMTNRRIRHLPVIFDSELHGVVSMGDLVKARIGELEADRAYLQSYICAG